jgi:tryptophan-rich sensory protein
MGIALFLIWEKGIKKEQAKTAVWVFGAQLALNSVWSLLFFGLHSPFYAFVEIIFLWIAIAATIFMFYKIEKRAAYLLLPYICWVTIAAFLNFTVWLLNPLL